MLLHEMKEGVSERVIIKNDKAMKEKLTRNYVPVDAMQSRTMSPTCVVDSMSNWKRRGSFSLLPLQGVLPLMSYDPHVRHSTRESSSLH
jgi:hypothetical protein